MKVTVDPLDANRAVYLLRVVEQFIKKNYIGDYKVTYDEAVCDGHCLAEDCRIAANALAGE